MAQPTVQPKWSTDETNVVEPSPGQKASGWTPGQKPVPSGYLNWWMLGMWLWLEWFATTSRSFIPTISITATNFAVTQNGADAPEIALRSSGSGSVTVDLTPHIENGRRLADVLLQVKGNGTVDCTFDVFLVPKNGSTPTQIGTLIASNVSNSNQTLTIDVDDTIDTEANAVVLLATANASGLAIYHVTLKFGFIP